MAFLIKRKKIWWKIRPGLEAPVTGRKYPCSFLGSAQSFECDCAAQRLFDFNLGHIERRFNLTFGIAPDPTQDEVSFLQPCLFSRRIGRDFFNHHSWLIAWRSGGLLLAGRSLADGHKSQQ